MDDILDFLKSKYGKILIGVVILAIVLYGVKYYLEKKKFGGYTQKEIEQMIIEYEAQSNLQYFIDNDPKVAEIGLYEVAYWHDINRPKTVQQWSLDAVFKKLKLDVNLYDIFKPMLGHPVTLTEYV